MTELFAAIGLLVLVGAIVMVFIVPVLLLLNVSLGFFEDE